MPEVITKLAKSQCLVFDPVINIANSLLTFEKKKNLVAQFLVSSMNHKLQCDGGCNDAQSMGQTISEGVFLFSCTYVFTRFFWRISL